MPMTAPLQFVSTMETDAPADVLPCPHFEGVEKRVEIDFHHGKEPSGA